jgi:glycosyltransferase involved in cell wall biosynthesis
MLLIQELSKRAYKQKIITRLESELANRLEGLENLEIIRISKPYLFNIFYVKNDHILHAHETKAAQFAFFAKLFFGIKYIITRRVDNPIKNNFFNKKMYLDAQYSIALSSAIKNEIKKISDTIRVKIVPSAYSRLEVDAQRSLEIRDRFKYKFLIGNIGELDNSHKGQFYLLEAMKKLAQECPDIHLVLLGKGKDELAYKEQVKDLSNVTFEGFVDNVGDYINALDLFVFPSLNEGLGSILFDIMQAKVPIAASNVGGIPDIVKDGDNGLLFESKNSDAIYETVLRLYNDAELRTKLAQKAYENVEEYSFEKMADRYEEIYKEIESEI